MADADIEGQTIADLAAALRDGRTTSAALVAAYLDRIARIDPDGPRAVLAVNPAALADAAARDAERTAGRASGKLPSGLLHGIPILVKDNLETADPVPTTAGSLALAGNITGRDAPVVARLRAAGAIVLGKANLTEWSNMRDSQAISGWSALGGQTRNPVALDRSPSGSSSGSAAGVAASLAPAALGTETDGSITYPSSVTGMVGVKPTVGLLSRRHIVPISSSQDTAGPIARSVWDAALLLQVMAGSDPLDDATAAADDRRGDYLRALDRDALRGRRLGVALFLMGRDDATDSVFEAACEVLRTAGAELVDVPSFSNTEPVSMAEEIVLLTELKVGLGAYLASLPGAALPRTLADLIRFNRAHAEVEMAAFGQDLFEAAEDTEGTDDPRYVGARSLGQRLAGSEGLGRLFAGGVFAPGLDAIVAPTRGPAAVIGVTRDYGPVGAACLPAIAGYPHVTVPMGTVGGLPVGLSLIGPAWSEAALLGFAFAYEQRRAPQHCG